MGAIIVITPLIIASWPMITAAVPAAIGSLGFTVASAAAANPNLTLAQQKTKTTAEIEVHDSDILANAVSAAQLVVVREDVRVVFARDARGALKLCIEGHAHSKAELKKIGEELLGRVTQQYVYHRIVSELKDRNMTIVDEQVDAANSVKIRVRNV